MLRDNDSGEDFFYMHRQMIVMVNQVLAQVVDPNYPAVQGWPALPPPGDVDYPVPPFPPDSSPHDVRHGRAVRLAE